jgi:hypothetical protein
MLARVKQEGKWGGREGSGTRRGKGRGREGIDKQRTQPPRKFGGMTREGNCLVVIWLLQIAPSKRELASLKMLKLSSMSL